MSRVQLSINVSDFDAAVAFYSRLIRTAPAKLRPGYANFAVDDPPLKLVLNSPGNGPGGSINHLGVEVDSTGEVEQAEARLAAGGVAIEPELGPVSGYARQDKAWARDPDGWPGSTTRSWSTSRRHDPAVVSARVLTAREHAVRRMVARRSGRAGDRRLGSRGRTACLGREIVRLHVAASSAVLSTNG